MTCSKCGQELKEGAKFCTKCGNRFASQNGQQFNGLAISSLVLMLIGILSLAVGIRFFGYFIIRFQIYNLLFLSGVILAFISLFKTKNKITLIAGIIAVALYFLFSFLTFGGFFRF
jgi:hypothetical membrane protein